ncbi:MAG: hypothetical protein ACTTKM_09745, partial [Prevotella fusca]
NCYFPIYLLGWETLVIKKDKRNSNRTGRWRFYTEDGRTMVVSYEDKDYQKGIFIMEGFLLIGSMINQTLTQL